ncbi:MAG TPA: ABC transporter ATP-binding protein [Chitinophagaceae bacterium]|nr:ABC transporter ATP-binding protein [Chitinophagaceae bacterium]
MKSVLEVQSVSKSYNTIKALNDISFEVPKGSIFGILGPNGSGKTTLLGILLNILKPDSGSFRWVDYQDNNLARKKIGALIETPNFYPYLDAVQNLKIVAEIKQCGNQLIESALQQTGLYERRFSQFKTFSLGMKQRLAIASTLISQADILVYDEPTNGLDPQGIAEIRNLIIDIRNQGKTIILASHLLDEVEKVCTDMVIIKNGKLLIYGPVAEIVSDEEWIEIAANNMNSLESLLNNHPGVTVKSKSNFFVITIDKSLSVEELSKLCFQHQIELTHLNQRKRTLESKFIEIVKQS